MFVQATSRISLSFFEVSLQPNDITCLQSRLFAHMHVPFVCKIARLKKCMQGQFTQIDIRCDDILKQNRRCFQIVRYGLGWDPIMTAYMCCTYHILQRKHHLSNTFPVLQCSGRTLSMVLISGQWSNKKKKTHVFLRFV